MYSSSNNRTRNVLIIDDNIQLLQIFRILFSKDFNVITAKDFNEVSQINENVSVVITDFNLPDIKFDDLLHYIKNRFNESLRILVTGNDNLSDIEENYSKEFLGIYSKPLNSYKELSDLIKNKM